MTHSDARSGTRVLDDTGIEHELGDVIGRPGAQGTVYRVVRQPEFAIKILKNPSDLSRIEVVRRLPLDGLKLSAPMSIIRVGGFGYLMPLASDMQPLASPYLPWEFTDSKTNTPDWFRHTGGLRRRLAISANVAQCLAGLHERGLAYVDLNPNNVMVSSDLARTETWLIDTDNLTSRSNPDSGILGFPGYLVPERWTKKAPASTLADAYTLAVLIFRLLVLRHPLEGLLADALDGDDARHAISAGLLPYVADLVDTSNRLTDNCLSSRLLDLTISGKMQQLFRSTFGAGKLDPLKRPGSSKWRDVLWLAHDNVIDCAEGCGWSYYRLLAKCPVCVAPTGKIIVATVFPDFSQFDETEVAGQARDSLVLSPSRSTPLFERQLWGRYSIDDPIVTFVATKSSLQVLTGEHVEVTTLDGELVKEVQTPAIGKEIRLRVIAENRPARILRLATIKPS